MGGWCPKGLDPLQDLSRKLILLINLFDFLNLCSLNLCRLCTCMYKYHNHQLQLYSERICYVTSGYKLRQVVKIYCWLLLMEFFQQFFLKLPAFSSSSCTMGSVNSIFLGSPLWQLLILQYWFSASHIPFLEEPFLISISVLWIPMSFAVWQQKSDLIFKSGLEISFPAH